MSVSKPTLTLHPARDLPPTRSATAPVSKLPLAAAEKSAVSISLPSDGSPQDGYNASLHFIGTATTILEWSGIRLMTDPNFLHASDHVHLGPGVTGTRVTNPAVDLEQLPRVDVVLLSHYHADHFDNLVEDKLRRDLPIITTPHAKQHLSEKKPQEEAFTEIYALDTLEQMLVNVGHDEKSQAPLQDRRPAMQVRAMPGKHVPPGALESINDLLGAVPPVNGWMLELGHTTTTSFECGYRIYITGDTLLIDDLKKIPEMYTNADKPIDLMLVHLGGTTIPGPSLPLLMVTMDAEQGVKLMQLVKPDITIPIHYDDYDVFLSPLSDFQEKVKKEGLTDKVVYLDRGEGFKFLVRN